MNIDITFKDAFILSIFCILIVFIVLMVISLGINVIKIFIAKKSNDSDVTNTTEIKKQLESNDRIKFEDIKDEEMLIAAFVASIDAVGDNDNKTVRIKKIKRL